VKIVSTRDRVSLCS